jgi:protein-S-isoprenylcysteine O-methyltransferase Ste14
LLLVVSSPEHVWRWQWNSGHFGPLGDALWHLPDVAGGLLVLVMILGFALCWWARLHLGRLWSALITTKPGHHIVDTGPYRLVRHPIYTGLLLSSLALAIIKGTAVALIGFALLALSFYMKARLEERFLSQQLGPAAYEGYRKRTPMLVPFWPVHS